MKKGIFPRIFAAIMVIVMLAVSCVSVCAVSISAPSAENEDDVCYTLSFENGVLSLKLNPDKLYDMLSDGDVTKEELIQFIPEDVLDTLQKGRELTIDDLTTLAANYITVDDIKALVDLVPTDVLSKYFSLDMLTSVITVNEILSLIPVDEVFNSIDPADLDALLTEDVLKIALNETVKEKLLTEDFLNHLINNTTIVDDAFGKEEIKQNLSNLVDGDVVNKMIQDAEIGPNVTELLSSTTVMHRILEKATENGDLYKLEQYFFADNHRDALNEFIDDPSVDAALVKVDAIRDYLLLPDTIDVLVDKKVITADNITNIFTTEQLKTFVNADVVNALLGSTDFVNSLFGNTTLMNSVLSDAELISTMAANGYFSAYVSTEELLNDPSLDIDAAVEKCGVTQDDVLALFDDAALREIYANYGQDVTVRELMNGGYLTAEQIQEEFPEITLKKLIEEEAISVATVRNHVTNDEIKDLITNNAEARELLTTSVFNNSDFNIGDYWDDIDLSILVENVNSEDISEFIKNNLGIYNNLVKEMHPHDILTAVGIENVKNIIHENVADVIEEVGLSLVFAHFNRDDIVNTLGGYSAFITKGYITFDEIITVAGTASNLLKFFDTNDIIEALGVSFILEYVSVDDIVDAAGGYSQLFALYSNDELIAIVKAIGTDKIQQLIQDNGIIETLDVKQIAKDAIELLKEKKPEIKELIKTLANNALSFLLTEVDGIYINDVKVFNAGAFDLNKIIVELLRSIPDIEDFLNLTDYERFAGITLTAVIGGNEYSLGVEVGFTSSPDKLQQLMKKYADMFRLDVSDLGKIEVDLTIPSVASDIYARLLNSDRLPDTLKEKLVLLPSTTVNDVKDVIAGITEDELEAMTEALADQLDKIREKAESADIPSNAITDKAEEIADPIVERLVNAFTSVDNLARLQDTVIKLLGKLPESLADARILDLYNGDGNFSAAKDISVDILDYIALPEEAQLLFESTTITAGASIDLTVNNLRKLDIVLSDGSTFSTLLPAGASLDVLDTVDRLGDAGFSYSDESLGNEMIDADATVYSNDLYSVTFMANGKQVDKIYYVYGTEEITEPPILDEYKKDGYTVDWSEYTLNSEKSLTVELDYQEITYYAYFYANKTDAEPYATRTFTISDVRANVLKDVPAVPEETGYTVAWEAYELRLENINVYAVYTPITYTAIFMADGVEVGRDTFTIEDTALDLPTVPAKTGYTGAWGEYKIKAEDIIVTAVYTPIKYTATFVANGVEVGTVEFTMDNTSLTEPDVPAKTGYTGAWEEYTIKAENITINAVYTPIKYIAIFLADGVEVDRVEFTVEDTSIDEPDVPAKTGYTGKWSDYTLEPKTITVNAVYTPIVYTATFVADGKVVGTVQFTVEDKSIPEPAVPEKEGYTGAWEAYELGACDITINAVYTEESGGSSSFWWWILIVIAVIVIIGIAVYFILNKRGGNTPPAPEPEPVVEPEPEPVAEPEPIIPVEIPEELDAETADTLMTDDAALEGVIISEGEAATGQRAIINIGDIEVNFNDGDTVTLDALKEKKLVPNAAKRLKVLAGGTISKALTVEANSFSVQAVKMIRLTGGTVIQKK